MNPFNMNFPAGIGIIDPALAATMAPIDIFRGMAAGKYPAPPIAATLGYMLIEADPGRVVFEGAPTMAHYNPMGMVHGGYLATLLDSCMTCAAHSSLDLGFACTTLEFKINFVRPLSDKIGLVRAEGKLIHAGRSIATAEGRVTDTNGKLYAFATTTCSVFRVSE